MFVFCLVSGTFSTLSRINASILTKETNEGQYEIIECSYVGFHQNIDDGGAIFVDDDLKHVFIDHSIFLECYVSESHSGGAIYFKSGQMDMRNVCAYKCFAGKEQFAYLRCEQNCHLNMISVSFCNNITDGSGCIKMQNGYSRLKNTNVSHCLINDDSIVSIVNPMKFTSVHCTLSSNEGNDIAMISGSAGFFKFWNMANNTAYSSIIIHDTNDLCEFSHCSFQNHLKVLFKSLNGEVGVMNSHIVHSGILFRGNVWFSNFISSNPNPKQVHFQTAYCLAEFPKS